MNLINASFSVMFTLLGNFIAVRTIDKDFCVTYRTTMNQLFNLYGKYADFSSRTGDNVGSFNNR